MNVEQYLSEQHVPFDTLSHPTTYSAQRTAHALHVPGDNFAKTVVVEVDGAPVITVLQAPREVDLEQIGTALGGSSAELVAEERLRELFPDCELGVIPPFGSQYGLQTIVDEPLTEDEHIVFDGNRHDEAIYIRYADYARIEQPRVAAISHVPR